MKIFKKSILLLLLNCYLFSQAVNLNSSIANPVFLGQKYVTDENGNIMMYVNVLGHVNNPGIHLVNDGIDISTLISAVGGFKEGANLKKIKIFRSQNSTDSIKTYNINLKKFFKDGNRDNFISIKPNDTIIIEQASWSKMLSNIGTLNTVLSVVNLYFLIEYNQDR